MTVLLGLKNKKNPVRCAEDTKKTEKVTGSQDDDFVGVLAKNILDKLGLIGRSPGSGVSTFRARAARIQDVVLGWHGLNRSRHRLASGLDRPNPFP
jgi:hypothetical protein